VKGRAKTEETRITSNGRAGPNGGGSSKQGAVAAAALIGNIDSIDEIKLDKKPLIIDNIDILI
jgi:hypothetical protein